MLNTTTGPGKKIITYTGHDVSTALFAAKSDHVGYVKIIDRAFENPNQFHEINGTNFIYLERPLKIETVKRMSHLGNWPDSSVVITQCNGEPGTVCMLALPFISYEYNYVEKSGENITVTNLRDRSKPSGTKRAIC